MGRLKQHSDKKEIQPNEIDKLFPFHFIIDAKMNIISFGPSLLKIIPSLNERAYPFNDIFQVSKPVVFKNPDISGLKKHCLPTCIA